MTEKDQLAQQIYDVRYVKVDNRISALEERVTHLKDEIQEKKRVDSDEFKNIHKSASTLESRLTKIEDKTEKHSTDLKEVAEALKSLSNTITKAVWVTSGIILTVAFFTSGYLRDILKLGGVQ